MQLPFEISSKITQKLEGRTLKPSCTAMRLNGFYTAYPVLVIESVLYHEIGHHVHRHTFGQDPDQEKEANDYSDKIMFNSSHVLYRIMRAVKKVLD